MSQYVIEAHELSRNFAELKAIQQLNLQVEKAQIYGFLGPNGCGKTTAIRMLTGLLKPSAGSICVLGYALPQQAEQLRLQIGYMTQKFSLYDDLTVRENLQFMARIYNFPAKQQHRRIAELLSLYDLTRQAQQLAGSMSGGQKQRLALAAATIHQPALLFLDEPTSAVDPENRRDFWEKLFDLCSQGTSILVSTHYMDEAERCHKLAILETGIKRADGTPEQLMQQMNVHVVEVSTNQLRLLKKQLMRIPQVISAAQLGTRLRVLVSKQISDPIHFLSEQHHFADTDTLVLVRPNLEDVFVSCTGQSVKQAG